MATSSKIVSAISCYLIKLIPVPDFESRKKAFPRLRKIHSGFNVELEPDYLCLLASSVLLKVGVFIYLVLLFDAFLGLDLFVMGTDLKSRILSLPVEQTKIMWLPAYVVMLLLYLRIRLHLDIKSDWIAIAIHPARLSDPSQSQWFLMSLFLVLIAVTIVPLGHVSAFAVIGYLGVADSPFFICVILAVQVFAVALCGALFCMSAVLLEKSYRYFDNLQKQLQVLVIQRDKITDKYKSNHKQSGR